jgi:hypothetical protein
VALLREDPASGRFGGRSSAGDGTTIGSSLRRARTAAGRSHDGMFLLRIVRSVDGRPPPATGKVKRE